MRSFAKGSPFAWVSSSIGFSQTSLENELDPDGSPLMNPLFYGPRLEAVKDYLREQFRFENIENFTKGLPSFTFRLIEFGLEIIVPALTRIAR